MSISVVARKMGCSKGEVEEAVEWLEGMGRARLNEGDRVVVCDVDDD